MSLTARDPTAPVQPADSAWFVEVVELARTGDKSAFDTLYQRFYIPIDVADTPKTYIFLVHPMIL